jgi:hypothetical protein
LLHHIRECSVCISVLGVCYTPWMYHRRTVIGTKRLIVCLIKSKKSVTLDDKNDTRCDNK